MWLWFCDRRVDDPGNDNLTKHHRIHLLQIQMNALLRPCLSVVLYTSWNAPAIILFAVPYP